MFRLHEIMLYVFLVDIGNLNLQTNYVYFFTFLLEHVHNAVFPIIEQLIAIFQKLYVVIGSKYTLFTQSNL